MVYISISEVNGFSTGVATFADKQFCSCKWTQLPDEVKSLPALTAGNDFARPAYHIMYTDACRQARMHECAQTHRLSVQSWLNMRMSESFNKRGNNRERLSIWGGCKERYEPLPLWVDWHILLFLSLTLSFSLTCSLASSTRNLHEWVMAIVMQAYDIKQHVNENNNEG